MLTSNQTNLISVLLVALFVILGCGNGQNSSTSNSVTTPAVSSITWADYDKIYGAKSKTTDMQKEQSWKDFEGKRVAWSGEVAEVSNGTFGGVNISIKMDKDTIISDVNLEIKKDYESAASKLTKGSKINFVGTLKSYGGAILPATLSDGELK